jgi:hypothetical protein
VLSRAIDLKKYINSKRRNSVLENKNNQIHQDIGVKLTFDTLPAKLPNHKNSLKINKEEDRDSSKMEENIDEDIKNYPLLDISRIMKDMNICREDTVKLYPALTKNYKERVLISNVIFVINTITEVPK